MSLGRIADLLTDETGAVRDKAREGLDREKLLEKVEKLLCGPAP